MRRYAVLRGANVARDLSRIRQHLIRSYHEFGDTKATATERANWRIRAAFDYMLTFATLPYRGTVYPDLRDSVRHVTAQQFIYYFEIHDHPGEVRILAVFFGGKDHLEQIAERLRERHWRLARGPARLIRIIELRPVFRRATAGPVLH